MTMLINATNLFNKIVLCILVLLPIYQDSPLSRFLGAAGYTFVMPLSLILITLYVIIYKCLPKNKYIFSLVKLGIGMTAISFIAIIPWLITGNSIVVISEFLPWKALKVDLQYFSYPAYITLIVILVRSVGSQYIGKYSFFTLIILTAIGFFEKRQLPYAFQNIHYAGSFPYWRIRLLTTESSWTAMMIIVYAALALYWAIVYKRKIAKIVTVGCVFALVFNTGSKTLLVSIAVVAIIYMVLSMKKLTPGNILKIIFSVMALILFAYLIFPRLRKAFVIDISGYSSTATRLYTSIVGLMIGVVIPCGVGPAVALGLYQRTLLRYLPWLENTFPMFNTDEIVSIATSSTDGAVTVKSGILNQNMYWGIIGTIILFRNFALLSKAVRGLDIKYSNILIAVFWTAIVLLFALNFSFEFWLLYAFLVCLVREYT